MKKANNTYKMYICGPDDCGEGVYTLVLETGETLASHFCSGIRYARGDLELNRPERQEEWKERFGKYEVLHIGDDDMTLKELLKRNKVQRIKNEKRKVVLQNLF